MRGFIAFIALALFSLALTGADISGTWSAAVVLDAGSGSATFVFKQTGAGRRKQVSVVIRPPNTCTLQNREQDDIVRKFLKDLGIYVA